MTRSFPAATYYNEHDAYAAQWLRNLIAAGLIAPGEVDSRSIVDVRPSDLVGFTRCHFFAGIGVWDYALNLAGWPADRPVWTGSCPCQPFSAAGRRAGTDDERHLWPVWYELIRECRPGTVLGEQVASSAVVGGSKPSAGPVWLDAVFADLEAAHYACGAADIPAAGVGAPHIRQRLWFVADAAHVGRGEGRSDAGRLPAGDRSQGRPAGPLHGGAACGLADVLGSGLEGRDARAVGHERAAAERGGAACGMVDPSGIERERSQAAGRQARDRAEQRGAACGLADADGGHPGAEGLQRSGQHGQQPEDGIPGFWSDADWIPCRDGKARPVEPGTFPLAPSPPRGMGRGSAGREALAALPRKDQGNRIGRLRGYGNAINAEAAAAFIGAVLETLPDRSGVAA